MCGPQPDVPVVVTWNDEKGFELWDQQSAGGVIATIVTDHSHWKNQYFLFRKPTRRQTTGLTVLAP